MDRILYRHNWPRRWGRCKCCGKQGSTAITALTCNCHVIPHSPCRELRGIVPVPIRDERKNPRE